MEIKEINQNLDSNLIKIETPEIHQHNKNNFVKYVAIAGAMLICGNELKANPNIKDTNVTIETLCLYDYAINMPNSTLLNIYQENTKQNDWVDNSFDIIALANDILSGTKQIEGEALEYLDKLFNNSGISKPTLPNRL